jgi:hypothetical protein
MPAAISLQSVVHIPREWNACRAVAASSGERHVSRPRHRKSNLRAAAATIQ